MTREQLFEQIIKKQSFLCVGLDTDIRKIPQHLLQEEDPIFSFNKAIIDATAAYCVAYKPNLAFYESMGVRGWISFEKTIQYLNENHPEQMIIADAKRNNTETLVLVDGAQSTAHLPVDVQTLGCDFYAFSGHKVYAPTGTGALWGSESVLDMLPPWQGGGEMISEVSFEKTTYNTLPFKYEAGTPNIGGNIVLAEALREKPDYRTPVRRRACPSHFLHPLLSLLLSYG